MKANLYPFLCIVLVLTIMTSCSQQQQEQQAKEPCKAVFPTLEYDIADVMKWDSAVYCNLSFQFFSGDVDSDAPWQLVCYGLQPPKGGKIVSSKVMDKLRVSTIPEPIHYQDSVIVGNNVIPLKLLQRFAAAAQQSDSNVKVLIFIPYDDNVEFPNYILYHIKALNPNGTNAANRYLRFKDSAITPDLRPFIKLDADSAHLLQLNPCPPANMLVNDINHLNKYDFFTADTRLVRGMVIAGANSNTTVETSPNAG